MVKISNLTEYEKLGWQIWSWRMGRGMTQQKLADLCGVSRSRISLIESGKAHVNLETLYLIAKALEIEIFNLFDPNDQDDFFRWYADKELLALSDKIDELE